MFRLGSLVTLRAGYAFRSAIPDVPDGDVLAVQLRDFQGSARPDWSSVVRTNLNREPAPTEWLRSGDILFAFRGARYFAAMLGDVPGPAVAATQFMLMRVTDTETVLPAFLAWQLNQPPAQAHFDQAAAGTAQRSLRRAEIEKLQIAIPSIELQRSIVELARLALDERETLQKLIRLREQQEQQIARSLLSTALPTPAA